MKNILILCFTIVTCLQLIGQNYLPLLRHNKSWDIFYWQNGAITPYSSGERQYLEGDTVIAGQTYQIVWANQLIALEEPVFVEPFGLSDQNYIVGFMREDTLARKIYFWDINYNYEYLTYDFNLQIGDSLLLPYLDSVVITLDTILEINTLGETVRKMFKFSGNYMYEGNDFYLEGIGGASTLVFPFDYSFEFGADIRCVQRNGLPLYNMEDCAFIVKTKEIKSLKEIKVFPNPTKDILYCEATNLATIEQVQLFDLRGKLLKSMTVFEGVFSLEDIAEGIYLLVIKTATNRFRQMVVKQ